MDSLNELISALKKLPGLGTKSAKRIAFHLLRQENSELESLGELISGLKKNLYTCESCGNISASNPCLICSDPLRDHKTICIIEDVEALSTFEQSGIYNGLYHVLNSRVSPLKNDDLSDEAAEFLKRHITELEADEVIIATNPKIEGDMAYYTMLEILKNSCVKKVTRLAFGLPIGGSIEFADKMTLHTALEARREVL